MSSENQPLLNLFCKVLLIFLTIQGLVIYSKVYSESKHNKTLLKTWQH